MSQRTNTDVVPEGVLYHIFNAFQPKKDIFPCSLVPRNWRTSTFMHIFRSIFLIVKPDNHLHAPATEPNCYIHDLCYAFFPSIQHII